MIARWRAVFDGDAETAGGDWDLQVLLAEAHDWTPEEIDRLDPDFIAELLAEKQAKAEHDEAESELTLEQRKAKQRHRSIRRRLKILDRKERPPGGHPTNGRS